jgi:parallel beta-helix repeat protein
VIFNAIGTDATKTAVLDNDDGVVIHGNSNIVGGDEEDERNVISGNDDAGIRFDADGNGPPIDNLVQGNVIGLDAGGIAALPNDTGVVIEDAHRNALVDNVISGNTDDGVFIEAADLAGADGNWLTGNTIEDNGLSGVWIDGGDDNLVGKPGATVNTIAGNGEDGVTVATGQDNSVANNSIVDNADLAIDLAADGPTANDGLLDADAGPNGLQNHPNITGRVVLWELSDDELPILELETRVSWNLRSTASTHYVIELYAGDGCGRGDAGDLVATRNVTTDATGLAEGSIVLDPPQVGRKLAATATVTDPNGVVLGAGSELSPCA